MHLDGEKIRMTTLTIFADAVPPRELQNTDDHAEIARAMRNIGIDLRQWPVKQEVQAGAEAETVLAAYADDIAALKADYGFESVDVVSMTPDHPARAEARQKFLSEHTHAEYEMRFFVAGAGAFYIRKDDKVYMLLCTAGDLISVPAGTTHWFDMSEAPSFTAIRFFTRPDGWVAEFTGDDVAGRYPPMTPMNAN